MSDNDNSRNKPNEGNYSATRLASRGSARGQTPDSAWCRTSTQFDLKPAANTRGSKNYAPVPPAVVGTVHPRAQPNLSTTRDTRAGCRERDAGPDDAFQSRSLDAPQHHAVGEDRLDMAAEGDCERQRQKQLRARIIGPRQTTRRDGELPNGAEEARITDGKLDVGDGR
ncbi:hypothetical protein C8R44DRAFT_750086 [Mycena epipterygia]|nr:hypothetical protein C8R44DRAFT_750086 [Mycena epipterygia]